MRIVTTAHAAGWEQYGRTAYAGLKHLPAEHTVHWYTEGYDLPLNAEPGPNVMAERIEDLPALTAFKARWGFYRAPDWRFDVIRFAHKVYAVHDALRDHDGLGCWMDADIVLDADLPEGYLESLLPAGHYMALFQRDGMHSEAGLWIVDCAHPQHERFMDTFLAWYETGHFRNVHEWHDSVLLDATLRKFRDVLNVHCLSTDRKSSHPFAQHPISRYAKHLKGPQRKALGDDPDRKAA